MKSVLYHNYEPNSDIKDESDDITCFLDSIRYNVGNKILLVGHIGNLGKRLRMLGVNVTILDNSYYYDVCRALIHNENCNVVKGALEYLPFEDGYFDKVIVLDHFDNINDLKKASQEINRVLKSKGELILEDLNIKDLMVKLKCLKNRIFGEKFIYKYPKDVFALFSDLNFDGALKEVCNKRYIYIGIRK